MSASLRCCQHQPGVDAHARTYEDMHVHVTHVFRVCIPDYVTALECHRTRGGEWGALNELERHNTRLFLSGGTAQALKAGLSVNRGAFRSLEACFFFLSPDRVHVLCLWLTHKLFGVDRLQYQSQHIATRCAPMFLFERWSGE